jgi:DNA end-binding protein Ku
MSEKWDPAEYHDSYREHVHALIEKKQAGHETVAHAEPKDGGKVIDLLEALQSSVKKAATRGRPDQAAYGSQEANCSQSRR